MPPAARRRSSGRRRSRCRSRSRREPRSGRRYRIRPAVPERRDEREPGADRRRPESLAGGLVTEAPAARGRREADRADRAVARVGEREDALDTPLCQPGGASSSGSGTVSCRTGRSCRYPPQAGPSSAWTGRGREACRRAQTSRRRHESDRRPGEEAAPLHGPTVDSPDRRRLHQSLTLQASWAASAGQRSA